MNLRQIAMSSALVMLANIGIAQAADMSSPSDATSGNPGGTAAAGEASTNAPNTAPDDPIVKGREEKRQAKEQYKKEKKASKEEYKQEKKAAKTDYKEAKSAANQEMKASGKEEESR